LQLNEDLVIQRRDFIWKKKYLKTLLSKIKIRFYQEIRGLSSPKMEIFYFCQRLKLIPAENRDYIFPKMVSAINFCHLWFVFCMEFDGV